MNSKLLLAAVALVLSTAACSPGGTSTTATTETAPVTNSKGPSAAPPPESQPAPPGNAQRTFSSTATVSGPDSGSRVFTGSSNLVDQEPVDIALSGSPEWIVGVPGTADPTWVVTHADGTVEAWRIGPEGSVAVSVNIDSLPPGTPPLVRVSAGGFEVVAPPTDASPLTYPALVGDRTIYVRDDGALVVMDGDAAVALDVAALPDSRISVNADGLVSVLAEPTDRYPHDVLGDRFEAGRIVVVDPATTTIVGAATVSTPNVIEGIAAPWVDVDGDGVEELLVTVSNGSVGAGLAVFDRNGELLAEGPPIGMANRWRNQLGSGPFGPNGEIEVVDVRVPHIGGIVEYFRIEGDELVLQTQQPGFTSHILGSRNLDMAIAADITGDGTLDVLTPTQDLTALGILTRTSNGVEIVAELPIPGNLRTNVAATTLADGAVAVAVGTSEGTLRVFSAG